TWNAVNGTWSVSSGRFLGRGGIAYKNVGNQSGFELAATIVPSTAPDGQVYVVPGDPRDLVLYLPFDGNVNTSVTTAYDYSAYANNGTLSNTTSATCFTNNACPSWTTDSKFGNATQYDGVGDYISIGNRAEVNFTTNSFTIAFWINSPGAPGRMVQKGNSDATGGKGYGIFFQSGTDLTFSINNGTGLQTIGGAGVTVTANQWDHVAYVVDRTSNIVTGYKNGVSKGTFSISNEPGDISATQGLNIGARSVGPPVNNFNGTLDEIMIFNRSLTAKEILFLYETSIKKITASGEIPSINNTENVTIVLASPGSSYFDNIKVKSGPANIRFVIPYQNIDIVNQTRFGPGDHNIVIRHYGINTTSNMPMIGVEE
ncbi:MAG: LamG domain-containing protein, partial [Candidatus Aenigmarchaeota archaeon]|nr:LamG domain-containing protein [Candidatus Aenigmarchaeota archaeon]